MMDPPGTNWPPNTLMPKRCAFESRPFLELPRPFLCAIRYSCPALGQDLRHLNLRVVLPVADGALVLLLALKLENNGFIAAALALNGGHHLHACYVRPGG